MSGSNHKRILIIDDKKDIVDALSRILGKFGTVESAVNGNEALIKMSLSDFDAIVSDIDMPVMDGIELYREALKINPDISSRFLFYTGYSREDHEIFFMKKNVSFLSKPSKIEDIEKTVQKLLDRVSNT